MRFFRRSRREVDGFEFLNFGRAEIFSPFVENLPRFLIEFWTSNLDDSGVSLYPISFDRQLEPNSVFYLSSVFSVLIDFCCARFVCLTTSSHPPRRSQNTDSALIIIFVGLGLLSSF